MSETHDAQETEIHDDEANPQLIALVREHPWIAVLGAAALGFVVARLVRGDR